MKYNRFSIDINELIPQQQYLSREKLSSIEKAFNKADPYGDIYVILYRNLVFCVDGHHRLYHLYHKGIKQIEVVNEIKDNESRLYQTLADEALELGIRSIADLEGRILQTQEEYQKLWIDKCRAILKDIEK